MKIDLFDFICKYNKEFLIHHLYNIFTKFYHNLFTIYQYFF